MARLLYASTRPFLVRNTLSPIDTDTPHTKGCAASTVQTILKPPMIPRLCFHKLLYSHWLNSTQQPLSRVSLRAFANLWLSRCFSATVTPLSDLSWWAVFAARPIHLSNWLLTNLCLYWLFTATKCFSTFWDMQRDGCVAAEAHICIRVQLYIFSYRSISIFFFILKSFILHSCAPSLRSLPLCLSV